MIYLYDGTFDGFLTCVYEHYHSEKADGIFDETQSAHQTAAFQPDMLIGERRVRTDEVKASAVGNALRDKISPHVLARVYLVFRTNTEDREMLLLNYIRFSFKHGSSASFLRTHPLVLPVMKAEEKISNEVHRLCGLIRFSAVRLGHETVPPHASAEILYATIEADHDVLEFLAPHFTDRFKNNPFLIRDARRGKALIAYNREWQIADFTHEDTAMLENTESEVAYRELWRRYYDTIAIKERTNPRLRKNFMPFRYWKYLPEMRPR